jgi:hypothetical protein
VLGPEGRSLECGKVLLSRGNQVADQGFQLAWRRGLCGGGVSDPLEGDQSAEGISFGVLFSLAKPFDSEMFGIRIDQLGVRLAKPNAI